jgi:hypothetical protein
MKKNYKESIVVLIGGAGVMPILMSIFLDLLDFGLAIIIAFAFFLVAGTLNGLLVETSDKTGPIILQDSQKQAILSLMGGIGVIVILFSIFSPYLEFGYGIVISYGFFLTTGVFDQLIECETSKKSKSTYPSTTTKGTESKLFSKKSYVCHSCRSVIEQDDIFCTSCGAEQQNF